MSISDGMPVNAATVNNNFMSKNVDNTAAGKQTFTDTTQSTDKDTGSVILEGGLGVEKNINSGGTVLGSNLSGTNTGDVTVGAVGASPNANGATLAGQVLNLEPANASNPGVITTGTQEFSGLKQFQLLEVLNDLILTASTDSTTTGSNATLSALTTPVVRLTNASLVSVEMIDDLTVNKMLIINNATGVDISILNDAGATAAKRILTGTGADLTLKSDASIWLRYDSVSSRWKIIGGSGSGGGVVADTYANISALARVAGTLYYATDELQYLADNGTDLIPVDVIVDDIANEGNYTGVAGKLFYDNVGERLYCYDTSNTPQKVGPLSEDAANTGNVGEILAHNGTDKAVFKQPFFERSYYLKLENISSNAMGNGQLYADGAQDPVDGSGGSPTLAIATNSAYPINAPYANGTNFNLRLTAGSLGDGYRTTTEEVQREDYGKMFKLVLNYNIVSGTYADGDLGLYILDSSNAKIPLTPTHLVPKPVGMGRMEFVFQMPVQAVATALQTLKVCLHQRTSSTGYVVDFTLKIVEQLTSGHAPIKTDWQSVTPVFAQFGTVSAISFYKSQDGKDLLLKGNFTTGTVGGGTPYIEMPDGLKIDDSIYPSGVISIVGSLIRGIGAASAGIYEMFLVYDGSDNTKLYFTAPNNGGNPFTVVTAASSFFASSEIQFIKNVRIAIKGWSSQSQVISEYDGRVIAASYKTAAGQNTNVIIDFDTKVFDTHNAVTTGASWKFTAPVSGKYQINSTLRSNTGVEIHLYKNGSLFTKLNDTVAAVVVGSSYTIDLVVGDYIHLIGNASATLTTDSGHNHIEIFMLSGAQQIVSGHKIEASYYCSSNKSSSTSQPIDFDTKEFDTTGSVTTGSSWKFTAPVTATYSVIGSSSSATGLYAVLYKNGTAYKSIGATAVGVNTSGTWGCLIQLNAGDYIDIRSDGASTINGGSLASGGTANISIKQVS